MRKARRHLGHDTRANLRLAGSPAFRDLGGAPASGGRVVAPGRLFRADALQNLDDAERARLAQLGLRLVCDLRSASERDATPCLDWLDPAPPRLHLELSAGLVVATLPWLERLRRGIDPSAAQGLMETTYAQLPRSAAPFLVELFDALVQGQQPVLVHCTAGKDRTGFTIAMILAALGVDDDYIRADYLRGSGRDPLEVEQPSTHMMDALIQRRLSPDECRFVHGVHASYLDAAFGAVSATWGNTTAYLEQALGMDARRREALRLQLLQ